MTGPEYTDVLQAKLEDLLEKIALKREKIRGLFAEIDLLEKQASNIVELLNLEGVPKNSEAIMSFGTARISDTAYQYLAKSHEKTPIHYQDLTSNILASGIGIPGKDPAANLLSHLCRDNRFVRVAPGMYGLEEWGLTPVANRKKRRKKTTRKKT